jgi:membrane associated rhomboid family serine protease
LFPLRDTVRTRRTPIVNWLLIVANLLVFLYEVTLPEAELERFLYRLGAVPYLFFHPGVRAELGLGGSDWLPVLTSQFLHGGWLHVISNLWVLYIFGDNVEDRLGSVRYLFFYLLCGVAASLLHLYTNGDSRVPAIGASGAIAGVMGAYFVLYPHARVVTLIPVFFFPAIVEIPAYIFLLFWFLTQFFSGTLSLVTRSEAGGIAWWAHVGGFLAGIVLLMIFAPPQRKPRERPEY